MRLHAYLVENQVIFVSAEPPVADIYTPRYLGYMYIAPQTKQPITPVFEERKPEQSPDTEEKTAHWKGIDYHVYGLGKHRVKFEVPDGARDVHCTYRIRK